MNNFNLIVVEGRLTRDPEFKYTVKGTAMLKFAIANNYYKKGKEAKEQKVMYFEIVAWEKLAEIMSGHLKKGKRVIVSGKLLIEPYISKNGEKKVYIQIIANNIDFIDFSKPGQNKNTNKKKDSIPY